MCALGRRFDPSRRPAPAADAFRRDRRAATILRASRRRPAGASLRRRTAAGSQCTWPLAEAPGILPILICAPPAPGRMAEYARAECRKCGHQGRDPIHMLQYLAVPPARRSRPRWQYWASVLRLAGPRRDALPRLDFGMGAGLRPSSRPCAVPRAGVAPAPHGRPRCDRARCGWNRPAP